MRALSSLEIQANTTLVLARLKENLAEHSGIVKEAKEGYLKKVEKALEKKLGEIRERNVVDVRIHLQPPIDNSNAYKVAIEMLTMHTEDTITLDAEQVKCFLMDRWDWSDEFYANNSGYSVMAVEKMSDLDLG